MVRRQGPAITPRPPQGQPLVTALAHASLPYRFAARGADVVYVTPHYKDQARAIVAEVREAEAAVGRVGEPLRVFADLVVHLDTDARAAAGRRSRLDSLDGPSTSRTRRCSPAPPGGSPSTTSPPGSRARPRPC
ncbi:LLM class flavin-dependent oxidoreductase [Sphaerisporangium sp. NPDC088356]|uniref:LLM class flavin-dependent oxidoreductase n=1 Tax=Sphaerisporangium sp. NPDC088356 TaxID=3154871 RepID=UPI0034163C00